MSTIIEKGLSRHFDENGPGFMTPPIVGIFSRYNLGGPAHAPGA